MLYLKLYEEYSDRQSIITFLLDFGMFITMNLAKIENEAIDDIAKGELTSLLKELRKPIINSKNYSELIEDINSIINNPKLLSGLFLQIRNYLTYIEPRIENYVKDSNTKNTWLNKIDNFKDRYLDIIKNPIT